MIWWAATLQAAPLDPAPAAAIELRSTAPAADLVPCIARALAKAGAATPRPIDGGTAIGLHAAGQAEEPDFTIRITEAGPQRVIRASYRHPVTAKLAHRLMAKAGGKCFAAEWRTHEWERR